MFLVLSKLLDALVDPLWWAAALLVPGLALLWRGVRRPLGGGLAAGGVAVLTLFSLPAVSNRLWASLEADAPRTMREGVVYDAVVLLGGVVDAQGSAAGEPAFGDNVERLLAARALLASGRARVVLVSGGRFGVAGLESEAEYLARELVAQGVEPARIVTEANSRNTRENAVESARVLRARGLSTVLVVTSAFHMQRALGCFAAAGLEVDALPVDYRMREPRKDTRVMPRAEYLSQSARALRERLGRLVYRLAGYSKD